ncbi:MAG: hypothetical protein M1839_004386 [Geoglossum umbratile]|nr:MAG: hypothetical protein M1839_004386 [Geoglossum umbratile]
MPPPALPPTPVSSTDISAKDGLNLSSLELSFKLPPPAIAREDGSRSSSASNSSISSFRPMSPRSPLTTTEHITSRRRPTTTATAGENFALPPPPTRSRKIIQMKPPREEPPDQEPIDPPAKGTQNDKTASQTTGSKRKTPSATSAAGRKIARKTAHSLIERRRRLKMNDEFGVLKQMIPACQNQDMHKLAILQASIDYLRYLEQCIADLKANNNNNTHGSPYASPPSIRTTSSVQAHETPQADDPDDVDMADPSTPSSDGITSPPRQDTHPHHKQQPLPSCSATTNPKPEQQSHYPFPIIPHSAATSPTIHPRSKTTSPALLPRPDPDQEAQAAGALLLLDTERRVSSGRGMSVNDLLSS